MYSFNEIIGHRQAVTTLQNALQRGKVAHAYLFYGPEGAGKTTLARIFAMAYLCGVKADDACGECADCRRFLQGNFPDYHEIEGNGGSIKIDQVREIQREAQYTSYAGKGRVYLLRKAENLTTEAANCILKVLEEPPAGTIFILTADNPYRLLPTILSRCQQIPLRRVSPEIITGELVKRWQRSPGDARVAAMFSDGLPGKAISAASGEAGQAMREYVLDLLQRVRKGDVTELFAIAEEMEKSKEQTGLVLDLITLWYRDQLVWITTHSLEMVINSDLLDELQKGEQMGKERIMFAIGELSRARRLLAGNANLRLVLEVLLLKLSKCA